MSYLTRDIKPYFEKSISPLVDLLKNLQVSPNAITLLGLVLVGVGSYFLYEKNTLLAFFFLFLGAVCDAIDGTLARKLGNKSDFGAFLDSVVDRFSDAMPFIALALSSEDKLFSLTCMLAMVFSYSVSYTRARAESLGYTMDVGLFERPERWMVLLLGILTSFVEVAVVVILIGAFLTTLQRIVYLIKKKDESTPGGGR
ncbi:CDP-alcohol phosphatidyltransferase family protein [Thermocrinis minervae]|uniref:CDP-diacylglycerol--glycerol-3-phosphate 3-phosphatidyltransferase n=1 Tax=Thermocrinis minervae TaxID=381751 RepID=A0A1M6QKL2_9AQUI|nr:CDP-alcohol phosphatidyltransferase family protein [Thermocrinis minervae]SHK20705.1 CDP-diacylglycerol--glycerol-3-phosphate 3-phosphatidyltransferase [Thermocrinis minervae]